MRDSATIEDVLAARDRLASYLTPTPLVRSVALEREIGLPPSRQVWIKDFGWTPVGSFKVLGALHWMTRHARRIGDRPVVAHSSGNFASGLAYAGRVHGKRVVLVMPETAPRVKFNLTRQFGAEILTYDIHRDHETGQRDRMTRQIVEEQGGVQASPYDDDDVIAGNGVGGLEIVEELRRLGRTCGSFLCPVSGGGLMAGHALAIADAFPGAEIIGVEPSGADDFRLSLEVGERCRLDRPTSICDGLLSYDVGVRNWPILKRCVARSIPIDDEATKRAMRWIYTHHGLRTEPSGAIGIAALLSGSVDLGREGDIVIVLSGRNIDEETFRDDIGG